MTRRSKKKACTGYLCQKEIAISCCRPIYALSQSNTSGIFANDFFFYIAIENSRLTGKKFLGNWRTMSSLEVEAGYRKCRTLNRFKCSMASQRKNLAEQHHFIQFGSKMAGPFKGKILFENPSSFFSQGDIPMAALKKRID